MAVDGGELNAHAKPPEAMKAIYKRYQKLSPKLVSEQTDLYDPLNLPQETKLTESVDPSATFQDFVGNGSNQGSSIPLDREGLPMAMYEVPNLPGLVVYPNLLSPEVQLCLLDRLLHRDLSNPEHQTNLQLHYDLPYPPLSSDGKGHDSFFSTSASKITLQPIDPEVHKPIDVSRLLNRKLRWITLGGQYDWTNKVYPAGPPPPFPADVKQLVEDLFPMKAEAAIVNFYSPNDTLSLHRDVSEECDQPLVSISLGCDGIFVVGLDSDDQDGERKIATIRLRSGDAVLMSGASRYAWHGVPKILENTCPEWMQDWPATPNSQQYSPWKGWAKGKRINLNVRQMFDG